VHVILITINLVNLLTEIFTQKPSEDRVTIRNEFCFLSLFAGTRLWLANNNDRNTVYVEWRQTERLKQRLSHSKSLLSIALYCND